MRSISIITSESKGCRNADQTKGFNYEQLVFHSLQQHCGICHYRAFIIRNFSTISGVNGNIRFHAVLKLTDLYPFCNPSHYAIFHHTPNRNQATRSQE